MVDVRVPVEEVVQRWLEGCLVGRAMECLVERRGYSVVEACSLATALERWVGR